METHFGTRNGTRDVVRSLSTLAFSSHRKTLFQRQLIAALKILQKGEISPKDYRGGWAGEYGQVQFMPSSFVHYAVDGNGDGKKDLLHSKADVFASAANYLKRAHWQKNQPWGREVTIANKNFDWSLADKNIQRTVAQWVALGVRDDDGQDLSSSQRRAILVVPAGINGPKFLVYKNFFCLLRWNNSTYYALKVGLLSDRIANKPYRLKKYPIVQPLTIKQFAEIKRLLLQRGYKVTANNALDRSSRIAIKRYQKDHGLIASGVPDGALLQYLLHQESVR